MKKKLSKNQSLVNTYGAEIEKPVANLKTGQVHGVSQDYFNFLAYMAKKRKDEFKYHFSDIKPKVKLGVASNTLGEQGLDNAFNLLETSLPYQTNLRKLYQLMVLDLKTTQKALTQENATMINMAIHPLGKTDLKSYQQYVAPKGLYQYLKYRNWCHRAGIDAKAQNSPTTGVSVFQAVDALSVILGFGSVFVGLFANSPIENGQITGKKETRSLIWSRMIKSSIFKNDNNSYQFPKKRFKTLKDYFIWMFGPNTTMWFVIHKDKNDYKTMGQLVLIDENPSMLEFLSQSKWQGTIFKTNKKVLVKPSLNHLELTQFANFAGARIRWAFDHQKADVASFLKAMLKNEVEDYFQKTAKFTYLEGRDPGANFPDQEILTAGEKIAKSVIISPSAIQTGLIKNLSQAVKLLNKYQWPVLGQLKQEAIKHGLEGKVRNIKVYDLACQVLQIAAIGLDQKEQWMLSYPWWVIKTEQTGADRALKQLGLNSDRESIEKLVLSRKVIVP